ncbi:MAG: hypothetical protein HY430_00215 [Candidatus Levybacteria bacterium]|nr:hypothetical protein [Candidatus Levybacteria bacterium]
MDQKEINSRIRAAYALLTEETTTREKFESVRTLIKGIHPKIDRALDDTSQTLSDYEKLHKGEIVELMVEKLPDNTEEQKKRKKALLVLIKNWKQLQSEVERVKGELEKAEERQGRVETASNAGAPASDAAVAGSKILAGAKGPLGILTIVAIIIVSVFMFTNKKTEQSQPVNKVSESSIQQTIKVIEFRDKRIPLAELDPRSGPDCDSLHYHARSNNVAKALDGTIIPDPGGCAYGKVKDVEILEVEN